VPEAVFKHCFKEKHKQSQPCFDYELPLHHRNQLINHNSSKALISEREIDVSLAACFKDPVTKSV
jgi:hypothetical protein